MPFPVTRSKASRDANAIGIESVLLGASRAGSRTEFHLRVFPRSPAHHATIAIAIEPSRAVGWGHSRVLIVPAILDPLRNIAVHVVKAKAVGQKAPDRHSALTIHVRWP